MRSPLLSLLLLITPPLAEGADVPLPEGAKLRIGDPNCLRSVDSSFAFSPDGKHLYVRETNDTVRPWNLVDGTRGKAIKGPTPYCLFATSPDGKWFANRENHSTVRLWNAATGSKERLWTTAGQAGQMAFTADSKFLVGVQNAKEFGKPDEMTVWNVTADEAVRTFPVGAGKDSRVAGFVVSPDGKTAAVVGYDPGPIRLFRLETGKQTASFGKAGGLGRPAIAFQGNDKLLVGFGLELSTFDVTKPDAKPTVTRFPRTIEAMSADGSRVAIGTAEFARFEIWDVATGKPGKVIGVEHAKSRSGMGFSPDGKAFALVAGAGTDPPPRVWDTTTGAELFANPGHPAPVISLAVLENGKTLASAAADGRLRFWDLATGNAKKPFDLTASYFELSADGSRLLAVSGRAWNLGGTAPQFGSARVYESATLKLLADYSENCSAVALSPDGKRIAMRTTDAIRVFDIDSEKLVTDEEFKEPLLSTRAFSFGPDSKTLLVQPFRGLLTFDVFRQPLKNVYIQSEGFVRSPDGKQLAAIRTKKDRVDVIDATTGKETASFEMKHPTAIAWSPDGKWVATANGLTLHVCSATTGKARLRKVGQPQLAAVAAGGDDARRTAASRGRRFRVGRNG